MFPFVSRGTTTINQNMSTFGAQPRTFGKVSDSPEVQRIQNRETAGRKEEDTVRGYRRRPPALALGRRPMGRRPAGRGRCCRGAEDAGALRQTMTAPTAARVGRLLLPLDASIQCARHLPYGGERLRSLISLMGVVLFIEGRRRFGLRCPTSSQRHGVDEWSIGGTPNIY